MTFETWLRRIVKLTEDQKQTIHEAARLMDPRYAENRIDGILENLKFAEQKIGRIRKAAVRGDCKEVLKILDDEHA